MQDIVYPVGDALYLNITNRCTNQCSFCIRYKTREFNKKYHLWLDREPAVDEIVKAIGDPSKYKQIVFCGYGEPLIRLDVVKAVAKEIKFKSQNGSTSSPSQPPREKSRGSKVKNNVFIRIDTNGHGNLFWGRNIIPELKGLIDIMSVSLDAENAEVYDRICSSFYGPKAYPAVIEFIKEAKKYIPEVEATIVDLPMVDQKACRKIAADLGVIFRVRSYYEETYVR